MKNNKRLILFIFEKVNGGELTETKLISSGFGKKNKYRVKKLILTPLLHTGTTEYIKWILHSIYVAYTKIKKTDPDFVYTTTFTGGVAARLYKVCGNTKLIFHYHGERVPPKEGNNFFKKITQNIKHETTLMLHRFFLSHSDLVIVPSTFSKNNINKIYRVDKSKLIVIPNGINISKYIKVNKEAIKLKTNIKKNIHSVKIILSVGGYNARKNLLKLIEVFNILNRKLNKDVVLILTSFSPVTCAEKTYKDLMVSLIDKYNLKNKVLLIENPDVSNYYKIADLYVSLSASEHLPLTLLESFASNLVYCSTPVGGVMEVLEKINPKLIIVEKRNEEIAKHINDLLFMNKSELNHVLSMQKALVSDYSIHSIVKKIDEEISKLYNT